MTMVCVLALAALVYSPVTPAAGTVYANHNTITAKSANGMAAVTFPDVCKKPTPPTGPVPVPYPKTGQTSATSKGSTKIKLKNGGEIEVKGSKYKHDTSKATEPNVTIKSHGKTLQAIHQFDVKLGDTSPNSTASETNPTSGSVSASQLPVLQTTDGQVFVLCGASLYAATLFPLAPISVEYVDPPPFEGPIQWHRSEETTADAGALAPEELAAQNKAARDKVKQYIAAHPESHGHNYRQTLEHTDKHGRYQGFDVVYGTRLTEYVARFDGQGNLVGKPAATPETQAEQTRNAYLPAATANVRWVTRTDIHGNEYLAKAIFPAGGGYLMFNENGHVYQSEIYSAETGGRRAALNDDKKYPVLSDRGPALTELPYVQLAKTRCPQQCQDFVAVYNTIASEMNRIIREMNHWAAEHARYNADPKATESRYREYLTSGNYDERIGPKPGKAAPPSVLNYRIRHEGLEEVLRELEPRLEDARNNLEKCRCPGQAANPLLTATLWGDPYLTPGPANVLCLSATAGRSWGSGDRCNQSVSDCDKEQAPSGLPPPCAGSPLASWFESDCGTGCQDIAVALSADWRSACRGAGYPIADDRLGFPAGACDLDRLDADAYEIGAARGSQSDRTDPALTTTGRIRSGLADQWGLRRVLGSDNDESTDLPAGSTPTLVAIIDSGIDLQHPDLLGRIWSNPGEIPGNYIDDDSNGLIDDINGWNFVADNNDTRDTNGHGTLVAGIIGARRDDALGIAGTDPDAQLMPIKVTNFAGVGNSVDLAAAITYAVRAGARIINISLGGATFSAAEQAAVDFAVQHGALLVIAAGNQGIDAGGFWPAALGGVITVAATERGDERAAYSNWGSVIDIAAPGTDILSLRARYTDLMFLADKNYAPGGNIVGNEKLLYHATGTSFAAPYVAGVASMLLSRNPELSAAQVKRMILNSARDISIPGVDFFTGYGLLDARAALNADPRFFIKAAINGVEVVDGGKTIQVNGIADADEFDTAEIQIGRGESPAEWKSVGKAIHRPVTTGPLTIIGVQHFSGSARWTLRVIVKHKNGSQQENRFILRLG